MSALVSYAIEYMRDFILIFKMLYFKSVKDSTRFSLSFSKIILKTIHLPVDEIYLNFIAIFVLLPNHIE